MACKKSCDCNCNCTVSSKKSTTPSATAKFPTSNARLIAWVAEIKKLCQPKNVVWCDGSKKEYNELCDLMVKAGVFTKLNQKKTSRVLSSSLALVGCGAC